MAIAASLVLVNGSLKFAGGDGAISAQFDKKMAEALLNLPPSYSLCPYSAPTMTASGILTRLSKPSYDSFRAVVGSDDKLKARYEYMAANFAAYAHPKSGKWPAEDGLMCLESLPVDLPWLFYVAWKLDGSITLGHLVDAEVEQMTPAEFEYMHKRTYVEYCLEKIPQKMEVCQRALSILAVPAPKLAQVTFINKSGSVETKKMHYWQPDQVEEYLHRNEMSHIATETE